MIHIRCSNTTERRAILWGMAVSDGNLSIDRRAPCTTSLLKAFPFSRNIQIDAKNLDHMTFSVGPHAGQSGILLTPVDQVMNGINVDFLG